MKRNARNSRTPIGKAPLRSRQFFWRKRRLFVSRCSSLSDIKPASTNKYSITGVRASKYSCGSSLSLVRPVLSMFFSFSLRFLFLDRLVIFLSSAVVVARTFASLTIANTFLLDIGGLFVPSWSARFDITRHTSYRRWIATAVKAHWLRHANSRVWEFPICWENPRMRKIWK